MKDSTREYILRMLDREMMNRRHDRYLACDQLGVDSEQIEHYNVSIDRLQMVIDDFQGDE